MALSAHLSPGHPVIINDCEETLEKPLIQDSRNIASCDTADARFESGVATPSSHQPGPISTQHTGTRATLLPVLEHPSPRTADR
jgi:hypothetical protein